MSKHPIEACGECGRVKRMRVHGKCNQCYLAAREREQPGYIEALRKYTREYQHKYKLDTKANGEDMPSPVERVRLFCRVFRCTADDLLEYIMYLRYGNKVVRLTHGHARGRPRKVKLCQAS